MFNRAGMHVKKIKSNLSFPTLDRILNNAISNHKLPGYSFLTVQYLVYAEKGVAD